MTQRIHAVESTQAKNAAQPTLLLMLRISTVSHWSRVQILGRLMANQPKIRKIPRIFPDKQGNSSRDRFEPDCNVSQTFGLTSP
jgi:hypothetical protein